VQNHPEMRRMPLGLHLVFERVRGNAEDNVLVDQAYEQGLEAMVEAALEQMRSRVRVRGYECRLQLKLATNGYARGFKIPERPGKHLGSYERVGYCLTRKFELNRKFRRRQLWIHDKAKDGALLRAADFKVMLDHKKNHFLIEGERLSFQQVVAFFVYILEILRNRQHQQERRRHEASAAN